MLYDAYSECNQLENARIKADFDELYRQMNGMDLREIDRILDLTSPSAGITNVWG